MNLTSNWLKTNINCEGTSISTRESGKHGKKSSTSTEDTIRSSVAKTKRCPQNKSRREADPRGNGSKRDEGTRQVTLVGSIQKRFLSIAISLVRAGRDIANLFLLDVCSGCVTEFCSNVLVWHCLEMLDWNGIANVRNEWWDYDQVIKWAQHQNTNIIRKAVWIYLSRTYVFATIAAIRAYEDFMSAGLHAPVLGCWCIETCRTRQGGVSSRPSLNSHLQKLSSFVSLTPPCFPFAVLFSFPETDA